MTDLITDEMLQELDAIQEATYRDWGTLSKFWDAYPALRARLTQAEATFERQDRDLWGTAQAYDTPTEINKRLVAAATKSIADIDFVKEHGDDLGRKNTLDIIREQLATALEKERMP